MRRISSTDDPATILLAGNPNVGKSTVFNALTGLRQHTGNWPGKTVAAASGICRFREKEYLLVDLPGTYSLLPRSPEEKAAEEFIVSGQVRLVIAVCDATCLERNLHLVLQLRDICPRLLVCLNLMDEAERKGIRVNKPLLSEMLRLPVIGVTARKKRTLLRLMEAAEEEMNRQELRETKHISYAFEQIEARQREASRIAGAVVSYERDDSDLPERKLDRILTGKKLGYPCMMLLLAAVMWITIKGANYPSAYLSKGLFYLGEAFSGMLKFFGVPAWFHDALVFGAYRMLSWVVSVMLPPMAVFFPLFTLLEDIGYLPRVAFNLDRPFHRCSACGKQALTMALGFGCNAAGVIGCRIIDSPRERLMAILTNSFVPCNGRFPILITLLTVFFSPDQALLTALLLALTIVLGVAATLSATKLLSATILKGTPSFFTLELPPYRRPQPGRILVRSVLDRTLFVLGRAAAVAAPAGLLLWGLANITINGKALLYLAADALDPIGSFFGMDGVILLAFILGWPANETVLPIALMIYLSQNTLSGSFSLDQIRQVLYANGWSSVTAVCVLLFTLFHWPCSTTVLTAYKETKSVKWTALTALLPAAFGFLLCAAVHAVAAALGC